jgi:hypothetical protein
VGKANGSRECAPGDVPTIVPRLKWWARRFAPLPTLRTQLVWHKLQTGLLSARRHAFAAKKPRLAARKIACLQFAARLVGAVNVRCGSFWQTGFKRFPQLGISHRAARRSFAASPRQPSQVLQSAKDFGCCEMVRVAVRPKRLQRRVFSQQAARLRTRFAFGLPQGA